MSGLLDQAGLTAGSGLTNGAGLYRWGNFNPFDPTDLDPYLLFDTGAGSMIGTLENPTLDLDPSNQETLDVITATRSSVATRTLPDGRIALAEQDTVRVDYTQGAELTPTKFQHITNTDFSTGWFPSNITISTNQAIAPDGSQTAIKLVQNNVTNSQFYTRDLISGGDNTYTYSLYAKQADAGKHLYFELGNARASVNLNDGSIYYGPNTFSSGWSNPSVSVVALDDGWYRVAMTATASSSVSSFYAKNHVSILSGSGDGIINDGDGTSGIYLWGPQLEEGTTASDFVANTTGSPKFLSSAVYSDRVPMILVEPSATNSVTNTDFSTWANSASNDSVGSAAPYGNFTKLTPSGNSSDAGVYKFISLASGALTQSCYAKFAGKHLAVLSAGKWTGYFNLQSGTATGTGAYIEPVGNGVFRCSVTGTDSSSSAHAIKFLVIDAVGSTAVTATGVDGVEIAMPQVEQGAVPTSYIPTSGSTVTRASDELVISGSDFDFYNQSEGTVYAEFVPKLESLDSTLFNFSDGSNFNRIMSLTKFYHIFVTTSGNTQVQFASGSVSLNNLNRLAASFKTNDCVLSLNGSSEVVDSSMAMPSINQINIGARFGGTEHLQGHIGRLIYWPVSSDSL